MTRREPPFKVGELARLAGVSVRALHHYEAIGLLVPSGRTASGHRVYDRADVERLARITALARLGMSLDEVRRCLDDDRWSPLALVETHLARARELLDAQAALVARLEGVRHALVTGRDEVAAFIETVEVMTMIETYYTKEQLEELARRREELGEEGMRAAEQAWADIFAELRAHLDRGTPPDAPEVQAIAARARALIEQFTGGDPGIAASLSRMYAEQPVEKIHPSFDPEVFAYMGKAMGR